MKKNKPNYDFSGYATKVGLKCTDGRTILQNAFQDCDGSTVPLVWQHMHNDPINILGHARLENRKDGVYAYCSFNKTQPAVQAKELVAHGDISALSIYANSLVEKGKNVVHGAIREVSLVIAGANPEAYIDNLAFSHGDGSVVEDESEAIICANETLQHADSDEEELLGDEGDAGDEVEEGDDDLSHSADTETLGDIMATMSEKQKTTVYALIAQALETAGETSNGETKHSNIEGDQTMKKNVFDKTATDKQENFLSHDALKVIMADAKRLGSLKESFLQHAEEYGIENIDFLMPDARTLANTPGFIKRDTEWVADVFGGATHSPFSRIKTVFADITADEARAKGYIKGNLKKDEVLTLLKRTTGPTTVYKKQKLDRDDIVDITDIDVVTWLKMEMRMMLEEEIARAQLVGDGRSTASDDKIKEECIRPIYKDAELYAPKYMLEPATTTSQTIDSVVLARKDYKGSGNPTFFSTPDVIGDMLLLKDRNERRIYNTITDLAAALRVSKIVEVPVMENLSREVTPATEFEDGLAADLLGIVVNMKDYSLGADKGGAINMFDDFDIDYNQFKYLIETRCSGALTMPKSALIIEKKRVIPKTGE